MDLTWTFGDRLRKIRRTAGLSQAAMAALIGLGPGSVANWESGASKCRDEVAVARTLEEKLGVPAAWTLGMEGDVAPPVTRGYPTNAPSQTAVSMTAGTVVTGWDKVVDLEGKMRFDGSGLDDDLDLMDAQSMREAPISTFIAPWCAARNFSPASTKQRSLIVGCFARSCGDLRPGDIDAEHVLAWWSDQQHLAPATRRSMHAALNGFFDFLIGCGAMTTNPMGVVAVPRVPRKVPKVLTVEQVEALRDALVRDIDKIAVEAMLGAGLRVSEVTTLRAEDFRDDGYFEVAGKGGHRDLLPIPARLAPLVAGREGRLVPTTPGYLGKRMGELLERAGVKGHTAHSLRRTFATQMLALNDITVVQQALRHSSLLTTQSYVAPTSVERWRLPDY